MKYNRIILSAVIALVMMLAPLPCFGETDALQYTANPSNAESWQSCDFLPEYFSGTNVRFLLDNRTDVCYTRFTKSNKCFY